MTNTPQSLLSYVRVIVGAWRDDPRDDTQLLSRFVEARDDRAFTVLLWRHGQLVWRICTRVLGDGPDAEDAFQATFLALARKAGQLRGDTLTGWLHRVARQTALNVDAELRRRRSLEQRRQALSPLERIDNPGRTELYAALDEEMARLPERLRVPLVLRYLEGKTLEDVARIVGCSRRVLGKRLTRGEAILRENLKRHGMTMDVESVAALLMSSVAVSAVPARLIDSTVRAAIAFCLRPHLSGLAEGVRVTLRSSPLPQETLTSAALAEKVMKTMLATKMKIVTVLLGVMLCLAGGGLLAYQALTGNTVESLQLASEPRGEAEAPRQPEGATRVDCFGDPLPAHALARMGTTRLWQKYDGAPPREGFLAFSPDGKTLASSMDRGTVCLWDAATGKEMRRLTTGSAVKKEKSGWVPPIVSLGFSPDGKMLVTMHYDQTICRWNVATGKFLRKQPYQGPKKDNVQFLKVAFLPGGQILGFVDFMLGKFAEGRRGSFIWDVATGKDICQLSESTKRKDAIRVSAFSPDGKLLATGIDDNKDGNRRTIIYLWEVATGKAIRQLAFGEGHVNLAFQDREINAVVFSPDGKMLASADREKICVREVTTGKLIHLFDIDVGPKDPGFPCNVLAYSPDGKTLLGGYEGGVNHLWDVRTGKEIRSFGWGEGTCAALFSPNGKVLAVGDMAGAIHLWEVATGKEIGPRKGYRGPISSIAYSPDSKTLASMGLDGESTVRLWEVANGKEIRQLTKHSGWGRGPIAYSPDGKMLLSMGPNTLYLWDTSTGKAIRQFEGRGGGFEWWATLSPDGKKLAAGWRHKLVCVWEVATGKLIYTLETNQEVTHAKQIAIAFSPDGRMLAAPGKGNTVSLWEVDTGKLIGQLGRPEKPGPSGGGTPLVFSLVFSPDGRLLATSSSRDWEGKVRLWEVSSGKEIGRLAALKPGFHDGCMLAFSPDGRMLATVAEGIGKGRFDPAVRLWEVASGKEIGRLVGHQDVVSTIAFSPDGKTLASGSNDLTCLVWDLASFTARLKPTLASSIPLQPLSQEQLEAAWSDLADEPAKAYAAIRALQATPAQAVPLLRARLRPVTLLADPQQLQRWITDLGADDFAVRARAQQELGKLGEAVLPTLRQALKDRPALEVKRRLKDLLAEWEPKGIGGTPQCLRELRAVQVLESIGTVEARQALQALAKGTAGARLTQEAETALAHLAKRPAARP